MSLALPWHSPLPAHARPSLPAIPDVRAWVRGRIRARIDHRLTDAATPRFRDLAAVPVAHSWNGANVGEGCTKTLLIENLARPTPIDWTAPILGELAGSGTVRVGVWLHRLSDTKVRRDAEMLRNKMESSIERRLAWGIPADARQYDALADASTLVETLPSRGREHGWTMAVAITLVASSEDERDAMERRVRLYLEDLQLPYQPASGEHAHALRDVQPWGRMTTARPFVTNTTGASFTVPQPDDFSMSGPRALYWGIRVGDGRPILIDHRDHKDGPENGNIGLITPSGNGKSATKKHLILEVLTQPAPGRPCVVVIDPEGEYTRIRLVQGEDAEHVPLVEGGDVALNVLDLPPAAIDDRGRRTNPVVEQTGVAATLVRHLVGANEEEYGALLDAVERTYAGAGIDADDETTWDRESPTLATTWVLLTKSAPALAKRAAPYLRDERSSGKGRGTYASLFASPTSVSFRRPFVHVDLSGLGAQQGDERMRQAIAYLVAVSVWRTVLSYPGWYVLDLDEMGDLLRSPLAPVIASLFVRARKYGLQIMGATQYVSDLLHSDAGRRVLGAFGSVFLMRQEGGENRETVAARWPQLTNGDLDWLVMDAQRGQGILLTRKGKRARMTVDLHDPGPGDPERATSEYGLCTTDADDLASMGVALR